MDMGSFKALELLLIVGAVGYFYYQQRQSVQRLKDEGESKQTDTDSSSPSDAAESQRSDD